MLSFKNWMETAGSISIALVGWTGSSTDKQLFEWVHEFLCGEQSPNIDWEMYEAWPHARKDVININQGRDFLKERGTYDVVILCWVFAPKQYAGMSGEYNVSDAHTPQEWKARVKSTNAKYIFASGGGTEVGGDYLGPLAGYRMIKNSGTMTTYVNWNNYS